MDVYSQTKAVEKILGKKKKSLSYMLSEKGLGTKKK